MPCNEWNNDWIAGLYDELPPEEERRLRDHLAGCSECRGMMDELEGSRSLLRAACPDVHAVPSVVVLRPQRWYQPLWAYAAGAACATLLFGAGLVTAQWLPGSLDRTAVGPPVTLTAAVEPSSLVEDEGGSNGELASKLAAALARLDVLEQEAASPPTTDQDAVWLTRADFDREMTRRERRADLKRSRDYEFLLQQIAAAEWRTGNTLDETREALNWVALRSDPRLRER